ncbi:MAG: hypothetical protein M0R74_12475 [Dehalococcoidia bacterium]|nr:hypothetical protein [Dehalococcoidia bacterium]
MVAFLLWLILFALSGPLALLALLVYPFLWLVLLPFRLAGFAGGGLLRLATALVTLPLRVFERR